MSLVPSSFAFTLLVVLFLLRGLVSARNSVDGTLLTQSLLMNSSEQSEIPFKQQVLVAIAAWLNENGIYADIESAKDKDSHWISFRYAVDNWQVSASLSVVDGAVRVGGYGVNHDIPLALPDSLERLVRFIKSNGNYDKDTESLMG